MKVRIKSQTKYGTVKSGKVEIETALNMHTFLEKNAPKDSHKIVIE